jgi:hypothetical protein
MEKPYEFCESKHFIYLKNGQALSNVKSTIYLKVFESSKKSNFEYSMKSDKDDVYLGSLNIGLLVKLDEEETSELIKFVLSLNYPTYSKYIKEITLPEN